jgi:hypothetical protein
MFHQQTVVKSPFHSRRGFERNRLLASAKEPCSFIISSPGTGAILVSANPVDVLIFIPLIPAIPVIATWFLPWERWIPDKIANKIIGPYLLYCAFAIWHFKQLWWTVLLVGLMGIAISAAAIFDLRKARMLKQARERKARMLKQARDWPVAEGFVLHNGQSRDADGLLKVTLSYMYKVNEEEFFGGESFTFTSEDDAERFESRCRERKLKVHYQQDKPEICVLDRDEM